jgi:hypothetical protein
MYMHLFFSFLHNKSNEITSLWPVFIWDMIHISSLFHRDETKPTHIIGINSFLFLIQLIYKHSSPNYQHMINYWKLINKMLVYICVCVSWNIFNRIHFFAICDVIFDFCNSFVFMWYLYMIIWNVDEAASTNFFFIIYNLFHIANQLHQHSCTSRTIASSQHHPRETRPLLGQSNLYKNCYIGFAYYEFVSYITRNASMFLLILFLSFSYFFFLSFIFIYNMKKWVNRFAYSFFCIQLFLFLAFIFILYMKSSQSICLFAFLHSAILFSFLQFHIIYENEGKEEEIAE